MGLTPLQASVAIALPVLLGSVGRIPLGILTDRIGGRAVFIGVLGFSLIPAIALGWVSEYWELLICGFFIGVPLAVFSVGVGFVSGWYPPQRQGTALGIYGAGNVGQSLAAFGAPLLVAVTSLASVAGDLGAAAHAWGFWSFALLAIGWLILFIPLARNAPRSGPAKQLVDFIRPLRDTTSWVLSLYYFLTFGGFEAMSVYLPTFLTDPDTFRLSAPDAGLRTAGFVVLATAMRPIGGWLSDRIGGRRILLFVFPSTAGFAMFMACPFMTTFTIGALGMAIAIGLGNGAVFKLVPQFFPRTVGSVTGLVGAAGGLGGFFPPLVVGGIKQATGSFSYGFVLLAAFAMLCLAVVVVQERRRQVDLAPAAP
jgi:NNP family nitrate/nitrite transporter-like MFS transporter